MRFSSHGFPIVAIALGVSCLVTGCVEVEQTKEIPSILGATDADTAYNAARIVGMQGGDRMIGTVRGDSMAPLLSDGTVIVIKPVAYETLTAGENVAYTNRQGEQVIHQLVRREGPNWVARGINNRGEDPDRVTPDNFIGILYAVFYNQGAAPD